MMERIERFLEDQHPLVRSNLKLGASILGGVLLMNVGVLIAVRGVERKTLFQFNSFLQLFQTLLLLMFVMMAYNALKTLVLFLRRQDVFTSQSVFWAVISVGMLALSLQILPDVFARSVSFEAGMPYGTVYEEFDALCQKWMGQWRDEINITLNLETEDLGELEKLAEDYRVGSSVFFNFGKAGDPDFGFACVIKSEPPTITRANNYSYQKIKDGQYQFIEGQP